MLRMRKYRERHRFPFLNQSLDTATRLSARSFEVVFSENPQLWRFDSAKCWHWVIAERRLLDYRDKILAFLAYLGRCVRQNEMGVIAMQVFVPGLITVLGPYSIETFEAFGEPTF